jgi:hypothetical protein
MRNMSLVSMFSGEVNLDAQRSFLKYVAFIFSGVSKSVSYGRSKSN